MPDAAPSLADRVAAAALAVPGVTGLHGGTFAVGTYLAGRRVLGVRLTPTSTEVHVEVAMGARIPELATAVVAAVSPLTGTPVQVVVEDVTDPTPPAAPVDAVPIVAPVDPAGSAGPSGSVASSGSAGSSGGL